MFDLLKRPLVGADFQDETHAKTGSESSTALIAWGKLARDKLGALTGLHPLLDHMTDVAACFLTLAECSAVRRSLENTTGRTLDAADLQRLAVLVFLHDVGKANARFQSRRGQLADRPPGNWSATPFGHGPEGWELITGRVNYMFFRLKGM